MESKVNYTIVGIFVIILTAIIIAISLWLTVGFGQKNYNTYLVYMRESVAGLDIDAPVKYNGVDVGTVEKMDLNTKNPQIVVLTLDIEEGTPINENTEAVLMQQGLTGIAFVGLQGGTDGKPLHAQPGETYPVIKSAPSFYLRLDQALQSLTNNFNSLSSNLNTLLDKQNLMSFKETLSSLQKLSYETNKQLPSLIKNLQISMHGFDSMSYQLKDTAHSTNRVVQSIANQIVPEAYDVLQNTKNITNNLQGLSYDFSQNPSMLLSGTKRQKPGPGE